MTALSERTLKSYTSTRNDILKAIPQRPRRVLDVGCSNGALCEKLKKIYPNAHITGIEHDEDLAAEARKKIDKVIVADLDLEQTEALANEKIDLFIFADVLEHTKNPKAILRKFLTIAAPDAKVIISLPNVQHWTAIYELLRGHWPERDRGLFDRTHLRWFTLRSIEALAEDCCLSISSISRNFRILDRPGGRLNRISRYASFLPLKNFLTYQYIVVLDNPARSKESEKK